MKKPKHLRLALLGAALLAGGMALPPSSPAQAPAPAPAPLVPAQPPLAPLPAAKPAPAPVAPDAEQTAIAQVVAEIAQQQAKIVENQKQMDAKMATITENLRLAKIFVSRGGGAAKK